MCVNIHDEAHHVTSLGMIRVTGSMPAEKARDLLDARLQEYGLNRERHIVGITTDGASVMVKLGRLLNIEHQQCQSHGVHLAVTDLIYKITAEPSSPILAYSDGEDDSDKELEEEKEEGKTDVIYPELNDQLMQVIKKNYFDTVL